MDLTPDDLRGALPLARSLFSAQWLDQQREKQLADPLFYTSLRILSAAGASRALREGVTEKQNAHPLAEAILGAERVLEHHAERKQFFAGVFAYRVLALRDVAVNLDRVGNMQERLARLTGDQWHPALYELLVACSQATSAHVALIDETDEPAPDIVIDGGLFLECKAKIQIEEKVSEFIGLFKRQALDRIFNEIAKIGDGLLIEIDVHDEAAVGQIPGMLRCMFAEKLTRRSRAGAKIKVKPYASGPFELPHSMKAHSAEMWRWLMDFDGWNDWHLVQPYAEFEVQNVSNMIVKSVRRPVLVCVRSTALSKSSQNIRATIAKACRRQLRNHRPGMVRVLVNSALYGIGPRSRPATIAEDLNRLSQELLDSYSRLTAVRFDIVTPPKIGELAVHYRTAGAVRYEEGGHLQSIASAPGVFLI